MKIWEEHRHPDTVPKRRITDEDIEFLKDLQKEMNEQDHFSQADPRYWVIEETERQWGNENGEPCIVEKYGTGFWDDMEDLAKVIDEKQRVRGANSYAEYHSGDYIEVYTDGEETDTLFDLEDAALWMNEHGMEVRATTYEDVRTINRGPMFLTYRDCCDHLRANYYHYSEDAHPYAMTAWRDPTIEKLYAILQEVDWNTLKGVVHE